MVCNPNSGAELGGKPPKTCVKRHYVTQVRHQTAKIHSEMHVPVSRLIVGVDQLCNDTRKGDPVKMLGMKHETVGNGALTTVK